MPIPLIFGIGAAVAAAAGIGAGVKGGMKMKEASDSIKAAEARNQRNIDLLKQRQEATQQSLESLGRSEKEIERSFGEFVNVFEKIKNPPEFNEIKKENFKFPECDLSKLKDTSVAAEAFIGSASGIGAGIASGAATSTGIFALIAAAGGTTAGGTAIAGLSGAAATNATLAWIGGGSLAAGGGGMALINKIIYFLQDLKGTAIEYRQTLLHVDANYEEHLRRLKLLVIDNQKCDYKLYTSDEKLLLKNTILLVGLLYEMCKVKLVIPGNSNDDIGTVNNSEVWEKKTKANELINSL